MFAYATQQSDEHQLTTKANELLRSKWVIQREFGTAQLGIFIRNSTSINFPKITALNYYQRNNFLRPLHIQLNFLHPTPSMLMKNVMERCISSHWNVSAESEEKNLSVLEESMCNEMMLRSHKSAESHFSPHSRYFIGVLLNDAGIWNPANERKWICLTYFQSRLYTASCGVTTAWWLSVSLNA